MLQAPAPLIAGSGFSIGGMRANELLSEYTLSQSVATERARLQTEWRFPSANGAPPSSVSSKCPAAASCAVADQPGWLTVRA